jgi:pimeloyl-ACP methyl ester carboxylesterase
VSPAVAQEAEAAAPRVPVRVGTVETADGAVLSYRVDGAGPLPPLLCSNGIGVSTFFWHLVAEQFGKTRPVITWDYRGHGHSPVPPDPDAMTVVQCARDLWTVADAVGARRPVLLGHSMGCQVLFEATRLQPQRPLALAPMLGVAGRAFESFLGGEKAEPFFRLVIEVGATRPDLGAQLLRTVLKLPLVWPATRALGLVHPDLCPREEFKPYFEHLAQLDLRGYFALARDLLSHDASDLLQKVEQPVLVVAGERDLFTPLRRSEEMVRALPRAELLVVPGGSHAALVEQPELIRLALDKLLLKIALA